MNGPIYAHREDVQEHDRYAAWLQALTVSEEPFALSDVFLSAFLRASRIHGLREPAHVG